MKGWLANKDRRERRDMAQTLTDKQVENYIKKIETVPEYSKLDKEADRLLRVRDAALVGLAQTFFKRGNENLHVKLGDVYYDASELVVSLHIEKKRKTLKFCPQCQKKNARLAKFCRFCGLDISLVKPKETGKEDQIVTKRKSVNYPFCKPIIEWIDALKKLELDPKAWLFPRYHYFSRAFLFYAEKPLTIQRFDQILQRLDPSMTSSLFRYGGAEKYLRLGYTPFELKEIGDWSSSKMPEIYATRKGLTPSQKRFTEDVRMI